MHPGPVNRGVELSAEVIDSPQALIVQQVESGVVVRMAVLYELLAGGGAPPAAREPRSSATARSRSRHEPRASSTSTAARRRRRRPADPRRAAARPARGPRRPRRHARPRRRDRRDRRLRSRRPRAPRSSTPPGLHAFPAFVDPHVHLRTPGREDEEDIDSGTRAAAAGGYCAILAMPNTDPVVDSASVLHSLRERARDEARVPTGFLAAITRGQHGRAAHRDGRAGATPAPPASPTTACRCARPA